MLKKKLKLLMNNEYYSNLNEKIELNFRARSLKYFTKNKNKNPIHDKSCEQKKKERKKKVKETYTGGYLNESPDEQKTENKHKSIFDKNNNSNNNSSDNDDNNEQNKKSGSKKEYKNKRRIRTSKPLKILLTDYAIESPFKYNPSYSFVYKNIPCIKINPKKYGPEIKQKIIQNIQTRKNVSKGKEIEKQKKKIDIKKCNLFGKVIYFVIIVI